jgi:hypothetical protein
LSETVDARVTGRKGKGKKFDHVRTRSVKSGPSQIHLI